MHLDKWVSYFATKLLHFRNIFCPFWQYNITSFHYTHVSALRVRSDNRIWHFICPHTFLLVSSKVHFYTRHPRSQPSVTPYTEVKIMVLSGIILLHLLPILTFKTIKCIKKDFLSNLEIYTPVSYHNNRL